jgi:putative addiction module CopG family antidote
MDTMNIALPESMKHFVQERVAQGGYSSVSEYVRELIRADQKRKVDERIDALLLEGLGSGQPISVSQEYWEEKKRRLTERLGKAVLPAADRDLDDQAAHLAAEASLETALRFYDAAGATFGKIASMPGVGERWQSANPRLTELRIWRVEGFDKHLIFYRSTADGIDIIRVLHGARDVDRVLEAGRSD